MHVQSIAVVLHRHQHWQSTIFLQAVTSYRKSWGGEHASRLAYRSTGIHVLLILMCVYLADHHFIMKNDLNTHFLLCQRCGPGSSTAVSSTLGSSNLKPVLSTIKFLIICKYQNNAFTCLYFACINCELLDSLWWCSWQSCLQWPLFLRRGACLLLVPPAINCHNSRYDCSWFMYFRNLVSYS